MHLITNSGLRASLYNPLGFWPDNPVSVEPKARGHGRCYHRALLLLLQIRGYRGELPERSFQIFYDLP
jgi:hypothetical protein